MFSDYVESGPVLLSSADAKLHADFRFTNTNVTIANTLRRAILVHTPSVGFRTEPYEKSDVVISINTTPLVNEMIAHRIGMIPVNIDPVADPIDSSKEFDPSLYTFELDVENAGKTILDVRAKDFKVFRRNPEAPLEAPVQLDAARFFPPDPITGDTLLITRLRPQWNPTAPKERIQLRAKVRVSSGEENIRWSPVSQASYEYTRDGDEMHIEEVFNSWLARYKKVTDPSTLDVGKKAELKREFDTMEIQRCYVTDERGNPNDFTFHVESVGIQSVPDIVYTALVACQGRLMRYQDIDSTLPASVRVQEGDCNFAAIDVYFQHESHTLGNLLETWLIDNMGKDDLADITYAGYKIPHPLRPEMMLRVGVKEGMDVDIQKTAVRRAIAAAARALKEEFHTILGAWTRLTRSPVALPPEMEEID
jgi:DNA-directed RNA polymerase subunit L/DNA-directed RNA polymerase alpha subunit